MPAQNIDDVIQQLDNIIDRAYNQKSRLGYFAAFFKKVTVNEILAARVDEVERQLARIWPALKLLDYFGGRTDEALINFSIEKARDHAWKVAQDFAPLTQPNQATRIDTLDRDVAVLS